jgi:precorrin-6B methylase 1
VISKEFTAKGFTEARVVLLYENLSKEEKRIYDSEIEQDLEPEDIANITELVKEQVL